MHTWPRIDRSSINRRHLLLLALLALLMARPLEAATVGTATFTLDIVDSDGFGFKGTLTFNNQNFDVFGNFVNLGALEPNMNITGSLTGFNSATGDGTASSSVTTLPAGCFARTPLNGCEGCACEGCVCGLDASCCLTSWSSACVTACTDSCSQSCPLEMRRLSVPNGTTHCRTANGAAPSLCTTIGDLVFFEGDIGTVIDLTNYLPAGLIYTLNGTATLVAGSSGATRTFTGQLTLNGFLPPDPITNPPCQGNPTICDDLNPLTTDACHPLLNCVHTALDTDQDGVSDDGNASGIAGDTPCPPGQTMNCDDNCRFVGNTNQADLNLDGAGDVCDDTDGDALMDSWEVVGLPGGVDLAAMGANPLRKDLFIEVDWMEGWSCQRAKCVGGMSPGSFCDLDSNCMGGGKCVNCTCPATACGNACIAGADVCTGDDETNGNDCECPMGTVDECVDALHCGTGGRCVFHSHKPSSTCLGGANKDKLCTTVADCPGSQCLSLADRTAQAFAMAPVSNPDGSTGITLHLDTGQLGGGNAVAHQENTDFGNPTPKSFPQIKACNFDFNRAPAFHYALFAHDFSECTSYGGVSNGIHTNDFIMTMGSWLNEDGVSGGTLPAQVSTFIHELGHNLGLGHGGSRSEPNYKPNYLSIMNYLYPAAITGRYDYSRSKLPDPVGYLDENTLDEQQGVPGYDLLRDGPLLYSCDRHLCPQTPSSSCSCPLAGLACLAVPSCTDFLNPAGYCGCFGGSIAPSPVDWNCDGTISPAPIVSEINQGAEDEFNARFACPVLAPERRTLLHGFNDWPNLRYDFRSGEAYDPTSLPCTFLTYEEWKRVQIPVLPDEVCDGLDNDGDSLVDEGFDGDGDGKVDCFDNCVASANANQGDLDEDGVGDACDPQSLPIPLAALDVTKLRVKFGKTTSSDQILVKGEFTLGDQSGGIFPNVERVTATLSDLNGDVFSETLHPGAFAPKRRAFVAKAPNKPGITVARITASPTVPKHYKFVIKVKGVDAHRMLQTPATFRLVAGDDVGAQTLPCSINGRRTTLLCRG